MDDGETNGQPDLSAFGRKPITYTNDKGQNIMANYPGHVLLAYMELLFPPIFMVQFNISNGSNCHILCCMQEIVQHELR